MTRSRRSILCEGHGGCWCQWESSTLVLLVDGHRLGQMWRWAGVETRRCSLQPLSEQPLVVVINLSSCWFGFICQEVSVVSSGCSWRPAFFSCGMSSCSPICVYVVLVVVKITLHLLVAQQPVHDLWSWPWLNWVQWRKHGEHEKLKLPISWRKDNTEIHLVNLFILT